MNNTARTQAAYGFEPYLEKKTITPLDRDSPMQL